MYRCQKKQFNSISEFADMVLGYYQKQPKKVEVVERLLLLLRRCPDCVVGCPVDRQLIRPAHVVMVCRVPHTLIWHIRKAKYSTESKSKTCTGFIVPAKVMYVDTSSQTLSLCLFETKGNQPLEMHLSLPSQAKKRKINLITESPPLQKSELNPNDLEVFNKSIMTMRKHVENLRKTFLNHNY